MYETLEASKLLEQDGIPVKLSRQKDILRLEDLAGVQDTYGESGPAAGLLKKYGLKR